MKRFFGTKMFELRSERCIGVYRGNHPRKREHVQRQKEHDTLCGGGRGLLGLKCGMNEGGAVWGRDVGKGRIIDVVLDQVTNVGLYHKNNGKSFLGFMQEI